MEENYRIVFVRDMDIERQFMCESTRNE